MHYLGKETMNNDNNCHEEIRKDLILCKIYKWFYIAITFISVFLLLKLLGTETTIEYKGIIINYVTICWSIGMVGLFLVMNKLLKLKTVTDEFAKCVLAGSLMFLFSSIGQMSILYFIIYFFIHSIVIMCIVKCMM